MSKLANDTRVFKINPAIDVQNVRFNNRYGFNLAGHLYLPLNFDDQQTYAAIVISGPFGAVKEQSSGLYAQTLAEQGFVTLAFDQSTTGESSGPVRNVASPDIFVEDFSAAVDFMGLQTFVDRDRIGAVGICGLGSHVLTAASVDVRIKAVATSVMYDMAESMWQGLNHSKTAQQRTAEKQLLAQQRWSDAENGHPATGLHELPLMKIISPFKPTSCLVKRYQPMRTPLPLNSLIITGAALFIPVPLIQRRLGRRQHHLVITTFHCKLILTKFHRGQS